MATSKGENKTSAGTHDKKNLDKPAKALSDVTCPICFGILIQPVTTPCNHELCLDCFNRSIELSQLACPICRRRISIWTRQATRERTLVDHKRWQQIQQNFPDHIKLRLSGDTEIDMPFWEDDDDASAIKSISQPGEVKQEYEEFLKQYQEERRRETEEEELASERLIQELQSQEQQQMVEERRNRQHATKHDQLLAKDIYRQYIKSLRRSSGSSCSTEVSLEQESTASSKMKGSLTSDILATLDKENAQLRSASAESHDSISSEMCHFKPISAAPRTPPKRLPDGRFEEPEVVHTKPRRLDYSNEYQSSKVLSIKIQAIMVDSQNKDCCSVPMHSSGTPFINKKFNGARKPNIDLSLKENYPFYSGGGSQSLSPTKSVLTGANQNGTTRAVRSSRANKVTHKSEHNEESNVQRKRKSDDKAVQRKIARLEDNDETNSSTSDSQTFSTNEESEIVWAELEREALDRIRQEEMDRQLAMQLQEEFNRAMPQGQQGPGNQYFLRSQKKK